MGFDTLGERYGEVGGVDFAGEGEDFLDEGEEEDFGGGVEVLGDDLVVVVGEFLGVDFLFFGVCSSSSLSSPAI